MVAERRNNPPSAASKTLGLFVPIFLMLSGINEQIWERKKNQKQITEQVKSFKKNCGVVPKPWLWNVVRTDRSLSPGAKRVGEKSLQNLAPVLPCEGSRKRASKMTHICRQKYQQSQTFSAAVPPQLCGQTHKHTAAQLLSLTHRHLPPWRQRGENWTAFSQIGESKSPGGNTLYFSHSVMIESLLKPASKG